MQTKSKQNNKKDYAPSVGFFPAKNNNGYTLRVTAAVLDTLNKAKEGDTLYLKEIPEEYRKAENSPHFRVSILPRREQQEENTI